MLHDPHQGGLYILAHVSPGMVALISLTDGNRWVDAVPAKVVTKLTRKEWAAVRGGRTFRLVPMD
jgi:hypothetical protein